MVLGPVTLDVVAYCEYMTILIEYILQCMLGKCNVLLEYIINGVCIYLSNNFNFNSRNSNITLALCINYGLFRDRIFDPKFLISNIEMAIKYLPY